MYKKILVFFIAIIYSLLLFICSDIQKFLSDLIPLFTTIITLIICKKSENFDFTINLELKLELKIGIKLDIYNFTTNIYHIKKIKVGKLPEEIISDEIIQPNSDKHINLSIGGPLSPKSKNIRVKLYVTKNANNKPIVYPKTKILNPNFDLAATDCYKFVNAIKGVLKS
jgi:hypothetical protein